MVDAGRKTRREPAERKFESGTKSILGPVESTDRIQGPNDDVAVAEP